jgi:hypothetical protein
MNKKSTLYKLLEAPFEIGNINTCPYCSEKQEPVPQKKKKCKNCGEFIFVRSGRLVTEKQTEEIKRL